MKFWQIQQDHSLKLVDEASPEPGPGQVRVAVKACGINRADVLQVAGKYPPPAGFDAQRPGLEYSGIVDAVGPGVVGRKLGDRVMGLIPTGAFAEQLVTHERETIQVPASFDLATAASIPEAFLTAYRALFIEGGLQPGQWCLVRPATAGVGLAAIQLASALGARPIGSSRRPETLVAAHDFGMLKGVIEDGTLGAQLRDITANSGVAVIMDMVGPDWNQLLKGLRNEGTLVLVGVLGGGRVELDLFGLLMRRQTLKAMTMRSQPLENRVRLAQLFDDRLVPLFAAGKLQPLPQQQFAFEEAPAALDHLINADFSGKRLLVMR